METSSSPAGRPVASRSGAVILAGVTTALVAGSVVYTLPLAADLLDDHFMHVVWGRQLLAGRLPVRDMVEPGLPLQAALSAASEWAFGYRLLSEGAVVSAAFTLGALLTFTLARRASGSIWVGALAAVLQIAIAPRSYSYPKILIYAAGMVLLWRYIDRPSTLRAAVVGAAVVVAFYLRHDHGLYLGFVALIALGLRHRDTLRVAMGRCAVLGVVGLGAVAPYVVYVQVHGGIEPYVRDLLAFAKRERQQNRFESWPQWPVRSPADVATWNAAGPATAVIGVRWSAGSSDEARRRAAARRGLRAPDDGLFESGAYVLTNVSTENGVAIINEPAIEDTSGLDRATGAVAIGGLWLGPLHILPALDTPRAAAGLLLFTSAGLVALTVLALARYRPSGEPSGEWERLKLTVVVLVSIITALGFIREPLAARIGDAIVAPVVLAAWWAGRWLWMMHGPIPWWRRMGRVAVALLMLIPIARSAVVVGAVPSRLEALGVGRNAPVSTVWAATWHRLSTTPPVAAWGASATAKQRAVRYVRACTPRHEPLLVLWFAPDLYYYADRPFAGRLGFYMEGYWTTADHERANLARLERERPLLAISEVGHEASDLRTYPGLSAYIAEMYRPLGELPANDGSIIRVLARKDRMPTSTYAELAWPCYV